MDRSLKDMMNMCMKMNEKIKSGKHKTKKQGDKGKLQS